MKVFVNYINISTCKVQKKIFPRHRGISIDSTCVSNMASIAIALLLINNIINNH